MNSYKLSQVKPWTSRKQYFFEILKSETVLKKGEEKTSWKILKRVANNNIEDLVLEKKSIQDQIDAGTYGTDGCTLLQLWELYYRSLEKRQKPPATQTMTNYEWDADWLWKIKVSSQFCKNVQIKKFTVPVVFKMQKYMNQKFSVRQNSQTFGLLSRLFDYALNEDLGIVMNPCKSVDRKEFQAIKKDKKDSKQPPVIVQGGFDQSLVKIKALLGKIKGWNFQHYVMLRLMTEPSAVRLGEVLPLLIQDYNPGTNSIDINKTVNTNNMEVHHKTKTIAGMRTVFLSDPMGSLIQELVTQHPPGTKLLFPSTRGTIIQGNNFNKRILNKFTKQLGIGHINPHSFRVFVITLRDYLNHKKENMMRDAGHASKAISDHYVRGKWVNADEERKDANQIAGLLE